MCWLEKEFPKTNKNIDDMIRVVEDNNFEYMDSVVYGSYAEATFEYVGDDMIFRTEEEYFDNIEDLLVAKNEWELFTDEQREVVMKNFREVLKKVDEKGIKYREYESDGSDYPCVIVTFDLE